MADDPDELGQDEIEAMLNQGAKGADDPPPAADEQADDQVLGQDEIEALLSGGGAAPPVEKPEQAQAEVEDGEKVLAQDDIEALLGQTAPAKASPAQAPAAATAAATAEDEESGMAQGDVEFLLNQAEQAIASIDAPAESPGAGIAPFQFQEFESAPASTENATLELIRDVELDLRIELGRTQMNIEDVLSLGKGSVVTLDKLAGDPVDIFVNGRLIARGEVLVLNDNFCVRIAELIAGETAAAG